MLDELERSSEDSLSNLKRRRARFFLTVLGVLIGTASIVVKNLSWTWPLCAVAVLEVEAVRRPDYDSRERCRCQKLMMYSEASEEVENI